METSIAGPAVGNSLTTVPSRQTKAVRRTKQQTSPGRPSRSDRHPAGRRADAHHLRSASPPVPDGGLAPPAVMPPGERTASGASCHSIDPACFPISDLPSPNDDRTPERPAARGGGGPARTLFFSPAPKTPGGGTRRKSRSSTTLRLSDTPVDRAAASLWRRLDGSLLDDVDGPGTGDDSPAHAGPPPNTQHHAPAAGDGWSSSEDDEPETLPPGAHPKCCNCDVELPLSTELYECRDGRRRWFCVSCPSPRRSPLKRRHHLTPQISH